MGMSLYNFLGFKKVLKMFHLPDAHNQQDNRLGQRPPQDLLFIDTNQVIIRLTKGNRR